MTTREIAGKTVHFDDEGFMTDPAEWSPEVATELAKEIGIVELTASHWRVIEFTRKDFEARGEAPGLRRIKMEAGVPTKELYELFPKLPAKKVAFVSGLGKPTGCI